MHSSIAQVLGSVPYCFVIIPLHKPGWVRPSSFYFANNATLLANEKRSFPPRRALDSIAIFHHHPLLKLPMPSLRSALKVLRCRGGKSLYPNACYNPPRYGININSLRDAGGTTLIQFKAVLMNCCYQFVKIYSFIKLYRSIVFIKLNQSIIFIKWYRCMVPTDKSSDVLHIQLTFAKVS